MKFFIKDFFSKCDQIRSYLRIWSNLLKKSLMENLIIFAMSGKIFNPFQTIALFFNAPRNSDVFRSLLKWKIVLKWVNKSLIITY